MSDTKITYVGPFTEVEIAATGQKVERGQTVEVDADLAASLLEQPTNWQPASGGAPYDGPVDKVLAWVGSDRERARTALTLERARKDRAGVTGPLEDLLAAPEPEAPADTTSSSEAGDDAGGEDAS